MSLHFGLAEYAYLYTRFGEYLFEIFKFHLVGVAFNNDGT